VFGDDRLVGEQPCGLSSSAVWDYESPGFQKLLSCARGGGWRARAVARAGVR
jgi:hypothetical protein